jgi:sulfopyruvate decarboxylase subunit beta
VKRIEALTVIDEIFAEDLLVVTCGATARELASFSRRDSHLPLLDAMGLTSAVGLGVALGFPGSVGVIDGDGSLLMGFSILPTLATYAPANLTVIVLDNEQHASADLVPSQAAGINLAKAARGLGLLVETCDNLEDLRKSVGSIRAAETFGIVFAKIEPGNSAGIPLLLADPAVLGAKFARAVGSRSES